MDILLWRIHSGKPSEGIQLQNTKPPFFLKTVEALLSKSGCNLTFIDSRDPRFPSVEVPALIKTSTPRVVILEATIFDYPSIEHFSRTLDEIADPPEVIVIGQAATAIPAEICEAFRGKHVWVIGGEPEGVITDCLISTWPHLNRELLGKKSYVNETRNLIRHQFEDFPSSPPLLFKKHEISLYHYNFPIKSTETLTWGHVIATRGCPHHCTFCTNLIRESYGTKMRYKDVATVLEEIKNLLSLGVNAIAFGDDDITASSEYLSSLCESIIESNLKFCWTAHVRIDECSDELLRLMKRSGCSLLRFGLESGSEKVLSYYQKHRNVSSWWPTARRALQICKKLDIQTCGLFILGSPQDTFRSHLLTAKCALFAGLDLVQLHFFTPYEGTVEARRLKSSAPLTQDHYSWDFKNFSKASKLQIKFFYLLIYGLFFLNPLRILKIIRTYAPFFMKNRKIFKGLCMSYLSIMTQSFRIRRGST